MTVPADRTGVRRLGVRPTVALQAVGGAVAVALLLAGVWAGGAVRPAGPPPPSPTRTVAAGRATLRVPGDWRPEAVRDARIADLASARTAVLRPSSGQPARVVLTTQPVDHASLLPHALRSALAGPIPSPRRTSLLGRPAWLYAGLPTTDAQLMDVTLLPTTVGMLAIACVSPARVGQSAKDCAASVTWLSLPGARTLAPTPDLAFRLRLPAVLATLDRARVRDRAALRRALTRAAQARWARSLARAHREAAASLRLLAGPATGALLAALSDAASAYSGLARAAGALAARQDVERAEARLTSALARLSARA